MNKFDTADYDEEVLKHLVRSPIVAKRAKEINLLADDFMSSNIAGIQLYREVARAALEIKERPISQKSLKVRINENLGKAGLPKDENLVALLDWFYSDILNEDTIADELVAFAKHRRLTKIHETNKDDVATFAKEASKLAISFDSLETVANVTSASPFKAIIKGGHTQGIITGFNAVDVKLHGLGREECGLIIGHSGSGKTAVTSAMAKYAAVNGYKALYISLEEPKINIIHRWYASQFRINYSRLHFGLDDPKQKTNINIDLQMAFDEMDDETRQSLLNLEIIDARDLCPINADQIRTLIDEKVAEGFIPDVVYVDQLEFMEPVKEMPKQSQPYAALEQCAKEIDRLSQYKILGEHTFALWMIHQGKGEPNWSFGYDDIAGFRGIVKPFDVCLGVGRHKRDDPHVNIFSMKTRHGQPFAQSYRAEFEFMTFVQEKWSPDMLKKAEKEANALERERKKPGNKKPKDYLLNKGNG